MVRTFDLKPVLSETGIHFAANATMSVIVVSYVFFVVYMRREGKESLRMRTELELAHGIQKTLVPPVGLRTSHFEVYGISQPSEKVGGDLVDAIVLPNGDAIAYVADIAGHGLQAGLLMGMLTSATRTALLDAGEREPHRTLPVLLDRLNTVLPEVKEPQMYGNVHGFPARRGRQRVLCAGREPADSAMARGRADLVADGGTAIPSRAAAGF